MELKQLHGRTSLSASPNKLSLTVNAVPRWLPNISWSGLAGVAYLPAKVIPADWRSALRRLISLQGTLKPRELMHD
jgi:hypothetical protein